MSQEGHLSEQRRLSIPNSEPYVLRDVLQEIPLDSDDESGSISITCVEHWNDNLYIGTSASEILHLVALPPESNLEPPTFILASRLEPSGNGSQPPLGQNAGVQKILVLPGSSKACVLCNGVLSFYSLPELSPAFPGKELTSVQWIGGIDENVDIDNSESVVVMIATTKRLNLVRVGESLRTVRRVDFPGCLRFSRRDTIACVADDTGYSLLEVEHQQKIPLSSISTNSPEEAQVSSQAATSQANTSSGHSRSKSLGNPVTSTEDTHARSVTQNLEPPFQEQRTGSPVSTGGDGSRASSRPRSSTDVTTPQASSLTPRIVTKLKPNILSPSAEEFMFTTGTTKTEPGVGVFVNLDGDVSRGTIEFDQYPESVLVHSFSTLQTQPTTVESEQQQFVLALLNKADVKSSETRGIEIQALSSSSGAETSKTWLGFPTDISTQGYDGLHRCLSAHRHIFNEVAELLQSVRYKPSLPEVVVEADPRTKTSIERLEQETALFENQSPQATSPTPEYEQRRTEDEKLFVARLGHVSTKAVAWCGRRLWQILPNPLILQLEHRLLQSGVLLGGSYESLNVVHLMSLLGSIREKEPQDETEYLTLNYIRQKASMILFWYLHAIMDHERDMEKPCRMIGNALEDGQIDPRVVLFLIPPLAREAIQGPNGVWLPQGIVDVLTSYQSTIKTFKDAPLDFWMMIRQYLNTWQGKRGYGSIPDEKFVLDSVDAALLHTLLYLDQALPNGSGTQVSVRSKLNNVVDNWKGDFQRAIVLLEHYRRFFVLSRLYQSRRLTKDVLATWKRIAEGEKDEDESLTIEMVEVQISKYLSKISNASLVQEYGLWLAKRKPDLAVQVFADDGSRVKLTPAQVVSMLKTQAPGAVQQYLEYLVFGKHLDQYADDLIGYYLDSVLSVLESSDEAKQSLEQSYATYRALSSPKPTYLNFITENAPQQSWWQSRLRLLQLLGSGGYATADASENELTYSVDKVLERLTPFSSYLVSESIILDARQGRHKEALRLLTHGLGDYDTAVRYCYFGGPTTTSSSPIDASLLPAREVQQDLLSHLFHEFLRIEDQEECVERASHLLGTFATWFDPLTVFEDIPEGWTVNMISEFLVRSMRAARSDRNQAIILKALSAAQNLQKQAEYIDLCEKSGPQFITGNPNDAPSQTLAS